MDAQSSPGSDQSVRKAFLLIDLNRLRVLFALLGLTCLACCMANVIYPDPAGINSWMYTELNFHPLPLQASARSVSASLEWLTIAVCFGALALLARAWAVRVKHQLQSNRV